MSKNQTLSIFKHALIYSGSTIIAKAVGFLMLPVYAHYLRGEGYGMIGMIDMVLSVLTIFIGYGIQSGTTRIYHEKKTETDRHSLISTAIYVMFGLIFLVSSPALLFNKSVAFIAFGSAEYGHYIILAVCTFIASMSAKNAEVYILIQQKSIFYSIISLFRLVIGLSLNIYLIAILKMGVLGYLYSGLITAVLSSLFIHLWVISKVGLRFERSYSKEILQFSLPLIPGYVAMFVRANTDRILLRYFLGLSALGAFEMLFKFATLIGVFIVEPFTKIWRVKCIEFAETEGGEKEITKIFTLELALMLFAGLILSLEIPLILRILTPEEFWLGGTITFLAVLSRIILACFYQFYFGLVFKKKTKYISYIMMAITVVSVGANVLLIIPFGILGAVMASCITGIVQCILGYRLGQRFYRIPYEWPKIIYMSVMFFILFLLINTFSMAETPLLAEWLNTNISSPLESLMTGLHLDKFKDGKLLHYTLENIPLVVEAIIKSFLSLGFILGLICLNIVPRQRIMKMIKTRSINN